MTDRGDLPPDREDEVRRLLADARHTEPMPAPVVERLDRVLAGLADEPGRERTVVRLADRRRRAGLMLVAAAAVVVAGVGIGQVISGSGGGGGAESTTAEAPGAAADSSREAAGNGAAPPSQDRDTREVSAARVRPGRFTTDVARLGRGLTTSSYSAQDGPGTTKEDSQVLRGMRTTVCEPGDWGRGSYRAVRYGTSVGYLVFRRPEGDSQVVDLFLCGSEQVARSVTLPRGSASPGP